MAMSVPEPPDQRHDEFSRRVADRLAEWQANYDAMGVRTASPLMDQIMAEEQVMQEMRDEGRWPTREGF